MSESTAGAPRTRTDARRNTARVHEVALQLLAERGSNTTIMDIAREAGVGKATVYRNFPTKAALLAFAVEHHGRWLVDRLDQTLTAAEGWPGFVALVQDTLLRIRTAPILLDALRPQPEPLPGPQPPIGDEVNERLARLVQTLLRDGELRADATIEDLALLIIGCSAYLVERSAGVEEFLRAAQLITDALHAGARLA